MDIDTDVDELGSGKLVIKVKDAFQIEQFIELLS